MKSENALCLLVVIWISAGGLVFEAKTVKKANIFFAMFT